MPAPVIRQFVGTIPDKGQAQTAFDTNVDAFLDWQALQFAPDLVAFGTFASSTAAALVAANLPSLTGRSLDAVRVNAAANGVEFANVTSFGWALLDDTSFSGMRTTLGLGTAATQAVNAAGTLAVADPQHLTRAGQVVTYVASEIPDRLNATGSAPMYACRAWVNFNGTGVVAIRASGNVSSVTDNGLGDYTVNFTTAMQDANYSATANWSNGSTNLVDQDGPAIPMTYGVGSVRILLTNGGATAKEGSKVSVAIFR
jgi:hypothetical protein